MKLEQAESTLDTVEIEEEKADKEREEAREEASEEAREEAREKVREELRENALDGISVAEAGESGREDI